MAIVTPTNPQQDGPAQLPAAIPALLGRLRRRIRAYVWFEGSAIVLVLLGIWFWASLGFDWFFEPPKELRISLLGVLACLVVYTIYRWILRRAFVRLADRSLALLLERRFSNLHESLLTAVELGKHAEVPFNQQMLAHTYEEAEQETRALPLGRIFDRRPLLRVASLAVLLAASVAAFAFLASDAMAIWARRSFLLSPELWPRSTHLTVEGFAANNRLKIARGSDVDLTVKAAATGQAIVPEIVEVRYSTSDGARGRDRLTRSGVAVRGKDEFQEYGYKFKGVLSDREFWVYGGDDRQGPFYLDVVDSPTLTKTTLHCVYPEYMRREPRDLPITGLVQIPIGTKITLHAEANKPLVQAQLDIVTPSGAPTTTKLDLAGGEAMSSKTPPSEFSIELPPLESDKTLLVTLLDADSIRSRDPVRLSLGALLDESPTVNVQLEGIGTAITPMAQLPAAGDIVDDYGLSRSWFDVQVDEDAPQQKPLAQQPAGRDKVSVRESLDVTPLNLQPKKKLRFTVQAADTDALAAKPNVGSSQKYVLDVVSPEQLRAMLEARELLLRRRFETMIEEFTETRDLLARLEPAGATGPAGKDAGPAEKKPADGAAAKKPPAGGAEPGDAPAAATAESPQQALASARVQAERVLQNSQRSTHETVELAESFDTIRAELINNRIDTEELKSRLKEGIADPLRAIVEVRFPEFEKQLRVLQSQLSDPRSTAAQATAVAQADKILVEMKQVLDRMLELETFNEVLEMLRSVITAQEKLNGDAQKQQRQKLRELIEE